VLQYSDVSISQLHSSALSTILLCSAFKLIQSVEHYVAGASDLLLKHNNLELSFYVLSGF
jgi:heme/copper-type cytochrome/quinol oxidase subunit 3